MDFSAVFDELYDHLERTTRLRREEAERVVAEVFEYFSESAEQFVRRRHAELQRESRRNDEIFRLIAAELSGRRFTAPPLTERQIRRLVYG
jgi:dGTP triphosphohydrolase